MLTVFAAVIILSKPDVTLFIVGIIYVSSGPIGWAMRMRSGTELEELPNPTESRPTASQEASEITSA